jgi:hypothetical protein
MLDTSKKWGGHRAGIINRRRWNTERISKKVGPDVVSTGGDEPKGNLMV